MDSDGITESGDGNDENTTEANHGEVPYDVQRMRDVDYAEEDEATIRRIRQLAKQLSSQVI